MRRPRGFYFWTLIIMVLVAVAIGYLGPPPDPPNGECRRALTRQRMLYVADAVKDFVADCGVPEGERQLLSVLLDDSGDECWTGPYLNERPIDGWGNLVRCSFAEGSVRIVSAGPDGIFGTQDDISDTLSVPDELTRERGDTRIRSKGTSE